MYPNYFVLRDLISKHGPKIEQNLRVLTVCIKRTHKPSQNLSSLLYGCEKAISLLVKLFDPRVSVIKLMCLDTETLLHIQTVRIKCLRIVNHKGGEVSIFELFGYRDPSVVLLLLSKLKDIVILKGFEPMTYVCYNPNLTRFSSGFHYQYPLLDLLLKQFSL